MAQYILYSKRNQAIKIFLGRKNAKTRTITDGEGVDLGFTSDLFDAKVQEGKNDVKFFDIYSKALGSNGVKIGVH